jgi:putative tricarboxylic transport membrane protein
VALAYIASATQIQTSFIVDPLGPKAFPFIIGAILTLSSLAIIFKPDADPEWPTLGKALKIATALAVLVGYAFFLSDLGFIPATAVAASLISYQIKNNARVAATIGVSLSVGLFVVFKTFLGLGLKAWPVYFTL